MLKEIIVTNSTTKGYHEENAGEKAQNSRVQRRRGRGRLNNTNQKKKKKKKKKKKLFHRTDKERKKNLLRDV
jgi:hypothetical protein